VDRRSRRPAGTFQNRGNVRRRRNFAWVILALAVVLAVVLNRYSATELSGVPRVIDGDSLEIGLDRIRLYGIDAPEFLQDCNRNGASIACGRLARSHLRGLIRGEATCSGVGIDRYERVLARCSSSGVDLNAAMVRDGWALDDGPYATEERIARQNRSGLWAMRFDSPQDWRDANPRSSEVEPGWSLTAAIRALLMAARGWLGW
jgi:endonuclease YncB( thermonuclease family)